MDFENSDDFVFLYLWFTSYRGSLEPTDAPGICFDDNGTTRLVYAHGGSEPLSCIWAMSNANMHQFLHGVVGERDSGVGILRIKVFFNLGLYTRQFLNKGYETNATNEILRFFALAARTTVTCDPLNLDRDSNLRFLERAATHRPAPANSTAGADAAALCVTPLWGAQRDFLDRAISLDTTGSKFELYPDHLIRVANVAGDEIFVDTSLGRVLHREDVDPPVQVNVIGGFLMDSIGVGKTLSMLALCALNLAPIAHHLDECAEHRREICGRIISRATLIICPDQVCAHWYDQINKHLARKNYSVYMITNKREHDRCTFADIASADFVIMSFNFIKKNRIFRAGCDKDGAGGWANFRTRLGNSLHATKRRRGEDFVGSTPLSIPHVYFWRVIVDEFHETSTSLSMTINALAARSRWALSASFAASTDVFEKCAAYALASVSPSFLTCFKLNYDCGRAFTRLYIKCDPNAECGRLPHLVQAVHWLDFTDAERKIYNSLHYDQDAQMRSCSIPRLTSPEIHDIVDCVSVEDALEHIRSHTQTRLEQAERDATIYRNTIAHTQALLDADGGADSRAFTRMRATIAMASRQLEIHEKRCLDARRSLRFVSEVKEFDVDCPICYDEMIEPHVVECGHVFCTSCCARLMRDGSNAGGMPQCPTCRARLKVVCVRSQAISTTRDQDDALRMKHGSKVAAIIRFVLAETQADPTEKFVIFSSYDALLHELGGLLSAHFPILFCKGTKDTKTKAIRTFTESAQHPIIMLSSENAGSGVCLTAARNIIIVDVPRTGSARAIVEQEKQIVGRVYRPPQAREVRVHRFVVKNTIEQSVYDSRRAVGSEAHSAPAYD